MSIIYQLKNENEVTTVLSSYFAQVKYELFISVNRLEVFLAYLI